MLVPTWISKASATQRAGRTGRVREGNVYRLYSRNAFHKYMQPFDQGELVRSPLDNTILSLRDMMQEAVTPILLECLEPPDISNIERSFQSLHTSNFISNPSDDGEITSLGSLVVALGIDLTLGAFVGLGIQFGVAAEATQMAAILSFPKSPWAISSPMYHDAATFNDIVSKTFLSKDYFDSGLYSEPMGISNLLHDYSNCSDRKHFCWKNGISATRIKHLYGTVESLKQRVAERLSVGTTVLEMDEPPYLMPESKVNILRILQVWLFYDTMIVQDPAKNKIESADDGSITIPVDGPPISLKHLKQIIDIENHPCEILSEGKVGLHGSFSPTHTNEEDRAKHFQGFEIRFVSYVLEKEVDFSFFVVGSSLKIFVPSEIWEAPKSKLRDTIIRNVTVKINEVCYLQSSGSGNKRGIRGRACGAYHPSSTNSSVLVTEKVLPSKKVYVLSGQLSKTQNKTFKKLVDKDVASQVKSVLSCNINEGISEGNHKTNTLFTVAISGECHKVSNTDLCDLFAAPDLASNVSYSTMGQSIKFSRDAKEDGSNNERPLIEDVPVGARLMSVLASERRKDNFIRFSDGSIDEFIDINMPRNLSINGSRWKRKSGGMCFVPENSVPCAVIPVNKKQDVFGVCANTLDLRGGACRVEGITLLPPGRMFVSLALLAFGVNPKSGFPIDLAEIHDYIEEEKKESCLPSFNNIFEDIWSWMKEKDKFTLGQPDRWRLKEALNFHSVCMHLGEELESQPDKIRLLCRLFDKVDGINMISDDTPWEGYDISLSKANASLRPKPVAKSSTKRHNTTNNNNGKQDSRKPVPAKEVATKSLSSIEEEHSILLKPATAKASSPPASGHVGATKDASAEEVGLYVGNLDFCKWCLFYYYFDVQHLLTSVY